MVALNIITIVLYCAGVLYQIESQTSSCSLLKPPTGRMTEKTSVVQHSNTVNVWLC